MQRHRRNEITPVEERREIAETSPEGTPLIDSAALVLRRARKLPVGEARNKLRHLAKIMMSLHRIGFRTNVEILKKHTIH